MEELVNAIQEEDLPPSQLQEVYVTLAKVLGNIVQNPAEQKFRTLKKDNRVIREKILASSAAVSLLLALGFEDAGAAYSCPADAGVEDMEEAVELLQCVAASREEVVAASQPAGTPTAVPAPPAPASAPAAPAPAAPAAAPSPTGGGGVPPRAETDTKKKPVRSAFDFDSRSRQQQQAQKAAAGLQDLRSMQKDKFKDFKADPSAQKAEAYQRPASIASGGQQEGWGSWLSGMFGGGSSAGSSGGGSGRQERRGPNVKGMGDLPKPVRRG